MKVWTACLVYMFLALPMTVVAQTPTGYVLAVFPPGSVTPNNSGVVPAATAPTPVFTIPWTAAAMTCNQPSGTIPTTPLQVGATTTETVVIDDPTTAGQACTFSLTALLAPQLPKLTPNLIYPVGVQATAPGVDANGNPITLSSDWDVSSDPFQRPAPPPAVPTRLRLTR